MENHNVIKFKRGVSDWKIVFDDDTSIVLQTIIKETIVNSHDETIIYLSNAEYIEDIKEKLFGKSIKKIVQECYVIGWDGSHCNQVFEYEDMQTFKAINIANQEEVPVFNIIFKSK